MLITLDSSVIVAAFRVQEPFHAECLRIFEDLINLQHSAIEPYTTLVEVAAAVRRRTGSESLATEMRNHLTSTANIQFVELDAARSNHASDIAIATSLRGMDAVVVQIATEFQTILITLDDDIITRVSQSNIATVAHPANF